jgi:hypothetical protein
LDTATDSPVDRLYAPITLLPSQSIVGEYGRNTTTISSTNYSAGARTVGTIKVANVFSLYGIFGSSGLRIRMYRNAQDQSTDASRSFDTVPPINSGVLFDALLNGEQDVFPYVMMHTTDALIYYTIDNITTETINSNIILRYFAYEPDDLIPRGYLPRHYKFSRDNTTALKRRNYLGCRDINTTFDNQPPFSVTLTTKNRVIVNNTTVPTTTGGTVEIPAEINTLILGGNGRLDIE